MSGPGFGPARPPYPAGPPYPTGPAAPGPAPGAPLFVQAPPRSGGTAMVAVNTVVIVVAACSLLVLLLLTLLGSSPPIFVLSLLLAVLPLTTVWLVVWFIDRWEPEPRLLLFGALFWGGGIATGGTLLATTLRSVLLPWLDEIPGYDFSAGVEAPVSEEIWKGLGLLVILLAARRHFNGPSDGIVYGCLLGAGFAFTENIFYFASVGTETGLFGLSFQFLVRGIALPLLHPICVSITGYAVGLGARRGGAGPYLGFLLGLLPAMTVHAIWNNGAFFVGATASSPLAGLGGLLLLFLLVMVPIFIGWILLVAGRRRRDVRLLRRRLGEYAAAGWFSPAEIEMLASMRGRTNARRWAAGLGPEAKRAMREFIADASRLATAREGMHHGADAERARREEHELLRDLIRVRGVLAAAQHRGTAIMAPPPRPPSPPGPAFPGPLRPGVHGPWSTHPGR
ncbi:MAG: PrsW family intramembrane metalloprotease [Pseudoclavibacter sp.]|nr:PrsW family intramembrane metalloprotease [Pseudoclavibacter sp.]